jgi:hypothetical protein
MIRPLTQSRRFVTAGCAALLLAAGAFTIRARAFNPQPDPPGYGMVGIATGQTARLNIVNVGVPDPTTGLPPDPCRARLQFVDADGNELASRGVAPEMGHAKFLDFTPNFVPVSTVDAVAPLRAEIRAVVLTDNGLPPGPCRVTLEIFDNVTGRSEVIVPPDPCRGAACKVTPQP